MDGYARYRAQGQERMDNEQVVTAVSHQRQADRSVNSRDRRNHEALANLYGRASGLTGGITRVSDQDMAVRGAAGRGKAYEAGYRTPDGKLKG